ncbi:MAG TPA: hypothetical protein VGR07_02985 [Thermoanaerobaculia bacterium]|jgi:hypothetical protein|nr:hypothetical protein [Thermoanaerobaculia bacterium]
MGTEGEEGVRESLARMAVPLAALAAAAAFAAHEVDRAGAAETGYLGGVAAAALAAVAALAPPPALELGLGATLAVTLLWTLPDGPGRGAALGLLLAVVLAIAAGRRLARVLPALPTGVAIPLALGLQVLLRGDLLLAPRLDLKTLAVLLGMPVVAGIALALLAQRHGGGLALLAGGTALLLAPGWSIASTLALVALAAGDLLGQEPRRGLLPRALAVAALLAPLAWEPRAGLLGAVAGLALAAPRAALVPALALAVVARLLPPAPGALGIGIATLPLLVPAFLLPTRGRWEWPVAALLLTVAARAVPGPASLAAPLALAALGLRKDGAAALVQRVWTGALLFGACLLAAYPWLRPMPLVDLAALLGPVRAVAAAAVLLVLLLELGPAIPGWPVRRPGAAAGVAAAALFLALLLRIPPPGTRLLRPEQSIRLDSASPIWEMALPDPPLSSLAVESVLFNSTELPAATPVATVRLLAAGRPAIVWTLRTGRETGEWAARRPDVARATAAAARPAPPPWMGWVAGSFFGQRYRTLFQLPAPRRVARLRIERLPGLPPDLEIVVQQLEVRR